MNTSALSPTFSRRWLTWLSGLSSFFVLSAILGFLPVLDGMLLRQYGYGVQPNWLETIRILDFPEILVELLVIIWALRRGFGIQQYWRPIPIHLKVAGLVFLSTFWIGSVLVSPLTGLSVLRTSYWLIHLTFGFAVYHLIKSSTIDVNQFINWHVAGIAFLTAITVVHLLHMAYLPTSYADQIKWSGAIPGCMSVRHFGILTGSIAALYVGDFLWNGSKKYSLWAAMFICTWLIGLTAWSGTRAAAVGFFAGLILMLVATRSPPQLSKIGVVVIASALALTLSVPLLPPDPAFGFLRFADIATENSIDKLSSGRMTIWIFVWNAFLDNWAFGWGEGALYAVNFKELGTHHFQPHNSVLQFLYSWGVFAAAAMFVIIASVSVQLHRKLALNRAMAGPLMMADALLAMSLLDGILFFSRMILPIVACLVLCFAIIHNNAKPKICEA